MYENVHFNEVIFVTWENNVYHLSLEEKKNVPNDLILVFVSRLRGLWVNNMEMQIYLSR